EGARHECRQGIELVRRRGYGEFVRALLAAVSAVSLLSCLSASAASSYFPPAGDGAGQWLSSGVIASEGADPQGRFAGIKTVDVGDSPPTEQLVVPRGEGLDASPDGLFLAFQTDDPPGRQLVASAPDGSQQRALFPYAAPVGWLSDSSRLIFRAP